MTIIYYIKLLYLIFYPCINSITTIFFISIFLILTKMEIKRILTKNCSSKMKYKIYLLFIYQIIIQQLILIMNIKYSVHTIPPYHSLYLSLPHLSSPSLTRQVSLSLPFFPLSQDRQSSDPKALSPFSLYYYHCRKIATRRLRLVASPTNGYYRRRPAIDFEKRSKLSSAKLESLLKLRPH